MKSFDSPGAFARHLAKLAALSSEVGDQIVMAGGEEIRDTARGMIGQYQKAVGPYPAWAALADSTEEEKSRLGYSVDAPLLRTGEMEKSIETTSEGHKSVTGSDDPNMVYQELGTENIPPRPALGPAAIHSGERIAKIAGKTTLAWLAGNGFRRPRTLK